MNLPRTPRRPDLSMLVVFILLAMTLSACSDSDPGVPDSLADTLRFNEIVMRCTHNSYHRMPDHLVHPSHDYEHLPLWEQFDAGVRAIELDLHSGTDYPVYHIPKIDPNSTCHTLRTCLKEVAGWSRANPQHHMMVVWLELKDNLDALNGKRGGKIDDYADLDRVIREALGKRLYTPNDFMRNSSSPRAALETEGWPTIGESRGRVMVVILNVDAPHYNAYEAYAPIDERAAFSRAREEDYEQEWAVVAKEDNPHTMGAIQRALDAGMLVASNIGSPDATDEANHARLEAGLQSGTHMLCDDFPTPQADPDRYWMDIHRFFPSGCNAKTAPDDCVNPQDDTR